MFVFIIVLCDNTTMVSKEYYFFNESFELKLKYDH